MNEENIEHVIAQTARKNSPKIIFVVESTLFFFNGMISWAVVVLYREAWQTSV